MEDYLADQSYLVFILFSLLMTRQFVHTVRSCVRVHLKCVQGWQNKDKKKQYSAAVALITGFK